MVNSICRVRRPEIVNFMTPPTPRGANFGVKLMFFLKSLLLYSQALIRHSKYVVMMTKEGSTKIVNFMTPGVGVLKLGLGHMSHYSKYVLSSTLSIYFTIDIVLKNYDAFFLCHYWFLFLLWLGSWYAKMSPSDKKSM